MYNKIRFNNIYDIFIIFILFLKIVYYILFISLSILHKYNITNKTIENLDYWNKKINFVFNVLISILIIYIFNPFYNNLHLIDLNLKLLFFAFGFIYLLSANWNIFYES